MTPAPPEIPWRPSGISRVHDERTDRRSRLRVAGWCPSDLVAPVCARCGADPNAVLRGRRKPADCVARAVIAFVACDGVGTPGETVAEMVGVSGAAVSVARHRGGELLKSRGWSVDEVLSWCGSGR